MIVELTDKQALAMEHAWHTANTWQNVADALLRDFELAPFALSEEERTTLAYYRTWGLRRPEFQSVVDIIDRACKTLAPKRDGQAESERLNDKKRCYFEQGRAQGLRDARASDAVALLTAEVDRLKQELVEAEQARDHWKEMSGADPTGDKLSPAQRAFAEAQRPLAGGSDSAWLALVDQLAPKPATIDELAAMVRGAPSRVATQALHRLVALAKAAKEHT